MQKGPMAAERARVGGSSPAAAILGEAPGRMSLPEFAG